MRRHPVDSTVLASIGFDPRRNVLEVEFRTGRVYRYSRVPQAVYDALLDAKSIGRYFNIVVREHFPSREVWR